MSETIEQFKKLLAILKMGYTHADGELTFNLKDVLPSYEHFTKPQKVFEGQNPILIGQWYDRLTFECGTKVWGIFKAEHPELMSIASTCAIDKWVNFSIETRFEILKVYTFEDLTK